MVKAGRFGLSFEVPDMQHPSATWLHLAARIKAVVRNVKVGVVGRVDPWQAEGIVRSGQADLVAMTRQHIADPETVNKLREGRAHDIRPCLGCNQGCVDTLNKHRAITCTVNPAVGREREIGLGTLARVPEPRRVVVVGGGPAGLKAAEIAARRGHRVILLEASDRLGGQVTVAARAPYRRDLIAAVDWLAQQVEALGVDVRLKTLASADDVLALEPDLAVVATGSRPTTRAIGLIGHGVEDPPETERVTTAYDVLAGWSHPSGRVVVVDDGEGSFKSASVAEALLNGGCAVTLVTPNATVGASIGRLSMAALMPRLFAKGIRLSPYTLYRGLDGSTVRLTVQGRDVAEPADWAVVAGWHEPDAGLYFALKGRVSRLARIGDCVAPRTLLDAIREGEAAGREA